MNASRAFAIARVTAQEILRDRLLYHSLLIAGALLALAYLAGQLTFVQQSRLITDFGFSAFQVSCNMIAILLSAGTVHRELERKTALLTLSKPLFRSEFLIGKWAGVIAVIGLNALVLAASYLGVLASVGGTIHATLIMGLILAFFEASILSSIALFFSIHFTASLSIACTLGMYLIGTNLSQFRFLATKADSTLAKSLFELIATLFPNLEHFHIGTKLTYGIPIPPVQFLVAAGYTGLILLFFVGLSCILFERKDL